MSYEVRRHHAGRPPEQAWSEKGPPLILPDDEHNRRLVEQVHPPTWVNPKPSGRYNLVVIGGGTAGLVSAAGAAGLGAKVALIEKHLLGGDCLNFGCVPSKALLRAARVAHDVRGAARFGVHVPGTVRVEFAEVMERMRRLRAEIAPNDSALRLSRLGVDVYLGEGTFVGPDSVEVAGQVLSFHRAIIATGGRGASLPVPGLAEAGFLTNETIFSLTELPRRLVVIGAGPIGCELAQAFRRFGSEVSIVSLDPRLLPREEAQAAAVLAAQFEREGIRMSLGARIHRVERRGADKIVMFDRGNGPEEVLGEEILVAAGRTPNVEGLQLERAGVEVAKQSIRVDDRLRTSNKRIYAAGDVCSAYLFTHAADAMARLVLQNALFFGRKRASGLVIPWCTYTDPEVAHVGLYQREAEQRGHDVQTFTTPLHEVDRAILDGETEGFAQALVDRKTGRILGATLVARHAGEMISEMSLAITSGLRIGDMSRTIHPYPTQAEAWKRLGDASQRARLTPRLGKLFRWWFSFMLRFGGGR
ncbi:MAG TPA: mercuric reductase [Myxococcaceae bacterium]|nr:mercuric reductase [Myxococcaceae bacterium]